jgi:hypothetical protein
MKRLLFLLTLSFFSIQANAGSCPDGSDPVKSISEDGSYFVYKCGGASNNPSKVTNSSSTASSSSNSSSSTKPISVFNPVNYSRWKKFKGVAINGFNNHNFQFINDSSKSRKGKQFQRFELRDGDCFDLGGWDDCANDRQRVEYLAEPILPPKGRQCIAFSIMLDNDFKTMSSSPTALAQIHQIGGPSGFMEGFKSVPGVLMFHAQDGYYDFDWLYLHGSSTNIKQTDLKFRLLSLDEMKGKWNDISFCLDFAKNNMSLWVNGQKKFNINQPPTGLHLPESIFFKYGIYQSFITKYKKKYNRNTPTQIVYYDEIRRGSSIEEVDSNINPNLKAID